MSDTLGKIVQRAPAGGGSTSDLFDATRALSAGAGTIFLTSDLNHLANITATRAAVTFAGFRDFYLASVGGTPSNPPTPSDMGWGAPGLDPGAANFRALIRVDTYGAGELPKLVLRCWVQAPPSGTESVGAALAITKGDAPTVDSRWVSAVVTNTAGKDVDLELQLLAEDLLPLSQQVSVGYTATGTPAVGEPIAENIITAWVGFYNTSNKNSDTANALGITLSLEAP